jgi:hypothetical protein
LVLQQKKRNQETLYGEWKDEWNSSRKGGHLRTIESTLPSIHPRWLYDSLSRIRTYLLTQLRTGHSWLGSHARLHQAPGRRQVRVWGQKTVVHVLVDCPRLQALRRELRRGFKDAFNSASALLGGRGTRDQATLSAVLDFAEASGRFQAGCRVELNAGTERNLHNHASTRH